MFELLLQADKALADGSLEQAERTYWQLIELDAQNAIAVAGLARVALERGDEKKARQFAEQALGIDPDSIAAHRILDAVAHTGSRVVDDPIAQQMLGAERLEALSHRRTAEAPDEGSKTTPRGKNQRKPAAASLVDDVAEEGDEAPASSRSIATATATAGRVDHVARPGTSGRTAAGSSASEALPEAQESRGRHRPDQMDPMPTEPLRERRKAGRLAAAAAAAAAAAREPVKARHHAMPIGRRFFETGELKAAAVDEFSEAEMAAAIEAVDAVDEPVVIPVQQRPAGPGRDAGRQADLLGAVEATDPEESVALRLAVVAEALGLDASEIEAARLDEGEIDEEANDSFEAAEAVASSSLRGSAATRGSQATYIIPEDLDFDAAEAEAEAASTTPHALGPAARTAEPATEMTADDFDAQAALADAAEIAEVAEALAASEAMNEVSRANAASEPDTVPVRRQFNLTVGEEPSEAEAEAQALREALAQVLDAEPPGGPDDAPTAAQPDADNAASETTPTATDGVAGTETASTPSDGVAGTETASDTPAGAEAAMPAKADTTKQPRRGGIFRRIRGG